MWIRPLAKHTSAETDAQQKEKLMSLLALAKLIDRLNQVPTQVGTRILSLLQLWSTPAGYDLYSDDPKYRPISPYDFLWLLNKLARLVSESTEDNLLVFKTVQKRTDVCEYDEVRIGTRIGGLLIPTDTKEAVTHQQVVRMWYCLYLHCPDAYRALSRQAHFHGLFRFLEGAEWDLREGGKNVDTFLAEKHRVQQEVEAMWEATPKKIGPLSSHYILLERLRRGLPVYGFCFTEACTDEIIEGFATIADAKEEIQVRAKDNEYDPDKVIFFQAELVDANDIVSKDDLIDIIESNYNFEDLHIDGEAFEAFVREHVLLDGNHSETYIWKRLEGV